MDDDAGGKSGARHHAKDARGLLLILGLLETLALGELARQFLLIDLAVGFADGFADDVRVHALGFQILHHAHATELFGVAAVGGVGGCVAGVVEIALLFEACGDGFDQDIAVGLVSGASAHQALQLGNRPHPAAQCADRILVQGAFRVDLLGRAFLPCHG